MNEQNKIEKQHKIARYGFIAFISMSLLFIIPMIWNFPVSLNGIYSILFLVSITASLWINSYYTVSYGLKNGTRLAMFFAVMSLLMLVLYIFYFIYGMIQSAILMNSINGGLR